MHFFYSKDANVNCLLRVHTHKLLNSGVHMCDRTHSYVWHMNRGDSCYSSAGSRNCYVPKRKPRKSHKITDPVTEERTWRIDRWHVKRGDEENEDAKRLTCRRLTCRSTCRRLTCRTSTCQTFCVFILFVSTFWGVSSIHMSHIKRWHVVWHVDV